MMTAWWTEAQIEGRVDREFVNSKLQPQEQVVLDKPLAFGDGLTDDTYIDWILQKAKKLFLILLDIGVPDQVFGVIDDSFDDEDLPLSLDAVSQLQLSFQPDDSLNKKFYRTQFNYLVRPIGQGEHGRYGNDEVVPVELSKKKTDGLLNHSFEKVHLPGTSSKVFARRKISLGYASGGLPEEDFVAELDAMKAITHEHIMSLWASYTQNHTGYILLTPAPDMSLKSFLTDVPQQFKMLPKQRRREILLNWPHCLADALSFLHWHGLAHQEIRPSNVFVDSSNTIFFSDIGSGKLKSLPNRKKNTDTEAYEYAAPEHWVKTAVVHQAPPPRSTLPGGGRTGRKIPVIGTQQPSRRSSLISDVSSLASYDTSAATSTTTTATSNSSSSNSSSSGSTAILHRYRRLPTDPQRSDIFSLACIALDILTHLLKRKPTAFASHRAAKNRSAGRGGAPADASFHVNLAQVAAWIDVLDKDAFAKDDQLFRAVPPILALLAKMLARDPKVRPTAAEVEGRLDDALFRFALVESPHCGTKHFADGDVGTRVGVAVSGNRAGGGGFDGGAAYDDESGSSGRMTSTMSLASLAMTPMSPSRRPSSKSSRSSGSTVRARTWPLGAASSDEVLGHFMSRD